MATRKKYKIVLSEKYVRKSENGKEWFQFPLNISGQLVAIQTIIPLDPYTEPDMEQVRKEAYEDGYKTAKVQCNIQAEKDMREVGERHYQHGLNDAWEAARILWNTEKRKEIFGYNTFNTVITTLTGQEALEKIRQYEQEKEEQIQVGDEVSAPFGTAVVTRITDNKIFFCYADGHSGFEYKKDAPLKTGRHFPEIAEVLQKMKES